MELQSETCEGDISLAYSNSRRASSAGLSQHRRPSSQFEQDVTNPSPQRLFVKAMFERSHSPGQIESPGMWPSTGTPGTSGGVSLNDDDNGSSESEASSPRWGADGIGLGRRPSSVQPPSAPAPRGDHAFSHTQRPNGHKRTGSNVGRSRSLNARIPSMDLSQQSLPAKKASLLSDSSPRPTPTSKIGWSRKPGEPRPPPLMSDQVEHKMSRWIKEIVVCNFDLEKGPVVERRLGGRRWGPGEKENVAFSSFPDTSLFSEGTILFSFKIRHIPPDPSTLSQPEPPSPMPDRTQGGKTVAEELLDLSVKDKGSDTGVGDQSGAGNASMVSTPALMSTGKKAEEYRKWDERGREWLYGFVWFEQRRDKGITRGYMQKSLVILTHLPFPALFAAVLHKVAPIFFEHGYSGLEAACFSIASWPDPTPDSLLQLPLLSDVLTVKMPDTSESPQIDKLQPIGLTPSPERPILASLPSSSPLRAVAPILSSLWSVWECLVLSEPLLIIAPDPRASSELVWWLRDLIRPLPPSGDFRPYLHIHDHDFSLLVNKDKPQPGVVVGVTNPFFRNAASHWPNVISIPSPRGKKAGAGGFQEPEGFISRRVRGVQKDRALLKRLEALVADGNLDDPEGNEALRTHFQQLTERFLVPLNRYFQTLVPTRTPSTTPNLASPHNHVSPSISTPRSFSHLSPSPSPYPTHPSIRPFSLPTFLSHLRSSGPNPLLFKTKGLTGKTKVENDFYAAFCMSAGFAGWLSTRVESLGGALGTPGIGRVGGGGGRAVLGKNLEVLPRQGLPSRSGNSNDTPRMTASDDVPLPPKPSSGDPSAEADSTPRPPLGERTASIGLGITVSDQGRANDQ